MCALVWSTYIYLYICKNPALISVLYLFPVTTSFVCHHKLCLSSYTLYFTPSNLKIFRCGGVAACNTVFTNLNHNQLINYLITSLADDELAAKIKEVEKKPVQDLTELDRILLLSKPRNGELTTAYVRIRESQEFKVSGLPLIRLHLDWPPSIHIQYIYMYSPIVSKC